MSRSLSLTFFLALGAQAGTLIVANKGDQAVGIIDTATGKQFASVAEGGNTGHELTVSPDGKLAYVPIYGDSGVGKPGTNGSKMVVIDLASRKVTGTLEFSHGVRPHLPVFGPKNGLLYVSTELDKTISIVDPKTLKIIGTVPTGQDESHMFTISPDGKRAYTANVGPGTVSVIDLESKKVLKVIPVSSNTQRMAISPDGKSIFTSDQVKPELVVIDTATNQVKTRVTLPASGYGTAPTPDGRLLVIAMPKANQVAVLDLATLKVTHTFNVPAAPQEVVVQPDGKAAYVSCDASGKVAVLNLSSFQVDKLIDAGKSVDGMAWVK